MPADNPQWEEPTYEAPSLDETCQYARAGGAEPDLTTYRVLDSGTEEMRSSIETTIGTLHAWFTEPGVVYGEW